MPDSVPGIAIYKQQLDEMETRVFRQKKLQPVEPLEQRLLRREWERYRNNELQHAPLQPEPLSPEDKLLREKMRDTRPIPPDRQLLT